MKLLEEYKELYYKEIEDANRLDNKITTCITFLTVLGSAQILLWTQIETYEPVWYTGIYLGFCLAGAVMLCVCIGLFFRTYSGNETHLFPIEDFARQHMNVLARVRKEQRDEAEQLLELKMAERFVNDAIYNRKMNNRKNMRHKWLLRTLLLAYTVTFLTFALGVSISFYETQTAEGSTRETTMIREAE